MPGKLRITEVERIVVDVPFTPRCRPWNALLVGQWRVVEVIRVTTDAGIVGYGETVLYYTWGRVPDEASRAFVSRTNGSVRSGDEDILDAFPRQDLGLAQLLAGDPGGARVDLDAGNLRDLVGLDMGTVRDPVPVRVGLKPGDVRFEPVQVDDGSRCLQSVDAPARSPRSLDPGRAARPLYVARPGGEWSQPVTGLPPSVSCFPVHARRSNRSQLPCRIAAMSGSP